jgi:hypothetical protein
MSNGLNFGSIIGIAASLFTGGSSLLLMAASQLMSQVATEAFSGALQNMGVSGNLLNSAVDAFKSAFSLASGDVAGAGESLGNLVNDLRDSANAGTGNLDRAQNSLQSQMEQIMQNGQQSQEASDEFKSSGKGGGNWLLAIAKAMGNALGKQAAKLVSDSSKLETLAGQANTGSDEAKQQNAMDFQRAQAEFQADSQMFGILSNAFSTAIKAIGEGMQSLARKS